MIQTLKRIVTNLALMGLLVAPMLAPATVHGQSIKDELCKGANLSTNTTPGDCTPGGTAETQVNSLLTSVINIFSVVVGVVAVIMIIIGGLKYITSAGDSGNITGAKNTILYAIIGLVIVAMAQFIVRFVLARIGA